MPRYVPERVYKYGYAFLPGYLLDASGEEAAATLGAVLTLGIGPPVHQIVPRVKESTTPNTYSGIYGLDRFPLHTDMAHWRNPPRYIMLRCVVGFDQVPTLLADGAEIVSEVGAELLSRALVQPRRPVRGKLPLMRIYQPSDSFGLVRWDELFFRPVSRIGELGVGRFRSALNAIEHRSVALAEKGDTVVIDNWRMLHARSPIPSGCEARILERAYMERLY